MEMRELVVLLSLSSWRLVIVMWLFLAEPWVCLQFVIVVFPYHTHLLFVVIIILSNVDRRGDRGKMKQRDFSNDDAIYV